MSVGRKMLGIFFMTLILALLGYQLQSKALGKSENTMLPKEKEGNVQMLGSNNTVEAKKSMNSNIRQPQLTENDQELLNNTLKKIDRPDGYSLISFKHVVQNKRPVVVYRFTKDYVNQPLGEHYSITVEERTGKLLGYTWMDRQYATQNKLITKNNAGKIALNFINEISPGLRERSRHMWTDRHDETILVDGLKTTVSGMKYKCYVPDNDLYYWVIVGLDGKIIAFEQDIIWSNGMAKRMTEQWLHDQWLINTNNF